MTPSTVGQTGAFHGKSSGRIKQLVGRVSIFPAWDRSEDVIAIPVAQ
jgi:hypothetical protein